MVHWRVSQQAAQGQQIDRNAAVDALSRDSADRVWLGSLLLLLPSLTHADIPHAPCMPHNKRCSPQSWSRH